VDSFWKTTFSSKDHDLKVPLSSPSFLEWFFVLSVLTFLLGFLGQFLIYVLSNWARILTESSCYCQSSDKKLGCLVTAWHWHVPTAGVWQSYGDVVLACHQHMLLSNVNELVCDCCCCSSCSLVFSVFFRIEVSFFSACSYNVGSEISLTLQLGHPSILFSLI
jgi:hypothetical protein